MLQLDKIRQVARRPSLSVDAGAQMQEKIITGEWPVGRELPSEAELVLGLGVSRTVVREALQALRIQGLIEGSQGRRQRVRPVTLDSVVEGLDLAMQRETASFADLVEVRVAIECNAAALAAVRASDENLAEMDRCIEAMRTGPDLESLVDADINFHTTLARASGNPLFAMVTKVLHRSMRKALLRIDLKLGHAVTAETHRPILEAVRRHDANAANTAMCHHLESNLSEVLVLQDSPNLLGVS